jgi:hypothetical protein
MARSFEVVPQTVVVGTPTNNFTLTFYYDFVDHSICKLLCHPVGTLAADTMVTFNRHGLATAQTGTIPAQDTATAIPLELNSGDIADSTVVHNAGFGV